MSDLEDFLAYEAVIDRTVMELPILQLPVRVPLSMIFRVLYGLAHGTSTTAVPAQLDKANSLAGRLTHLVPLLANCPAEPTGVDARDVSDSYHDADRDGSQAKVLLTYAHFADFMPEVHRGYFSVSRTGSQQFTLRHHSTESANAEAEDILLSELALSFPTQPQPFSEQFFDGLAKNPPGTLSADSVLAIKELSTHYSGQAFEVRLIDDHGLRVALGVSIEEFARFRGALLGMAVFSLGLAGAFERRLARNRDDEEAFSEWLHWLAPTWGHEFFRGYLMTESGLSDRQVERLLTLLSVDFRYGKPQTKHARDGYFPPLWQLPGMLLLGSDAAFLFTQVRNLLFAVQSTDKVLFDSAVSAHLEPALIDVARQVLARLSHLDVRTNVNWTCGSKNGEIDVLVFHSAENAAIHIQAKAPLAPQGARMVQRLEDRIDEGLSQLERFRNLPESDRDRIISNAIGREVRSVKVIDAILARSCFGTQSIREKSTAVNLLTLSMLAGAVSDCASMAGAGIEFLLERYQKLTTQLLRDASPRWEFETLRINELEVELPLLRFNEASVAQLRSHVWRDNMTLGSVA